MASAAQQSARQKFMDMIHKKKPAENEAVDNPAEEAAESPKEEADEEMKARVSKVKKMTPEQKKALLEKAAKSKK